MAFAPWMTGPRSARSRRYDRSKSEDAIKLDLSEDPKIIAREILTALSVNSLHEGKLLAYLNNFIKLILHISSDVSLLGYTIEEILYCLRYCVAHESSVVRAGAFRAMRHIIANEEDVALLNELLIPYLIVRALDLEYKNDAVRVEAVKLTRKALLIAPSRFHLALSRYLVAFANGVSEEKDRMLRVYLAVLCELGTLNPDAFITAGGVAAITRNLLECQTPKISESLCGVLLLLLDRPITRNHAGVDLHCVAAPYCDFHYRHGWMDKNRDERDVKFNCSRLALLTILRSWPGILHFCSPTDVSGLKAIVDVLYLNQLEVRKAVLDLLYELLNLPQPEWTDELSVALSAVDPAEPQAAWRLGEGFVAAEGRSILPHLARTTPSIADMHLSLLLYCFLETGLLGALSEVIATSDTFISVRATVLLGELLRLIQVLLPPECCNITPALPSLIEYATSNPQALRAISALQQLHKLLKRRPASNSLYLDYILRAGSSIKSSQRIERPRGHKTSTRSRLTQLVGRDADDAVKDTGVLANKDAFTWNWNVIKIILKRESDFTLDLNDQNHRSFLKRIVEYYLPSSNRYSHMDLTSPKNPQGYTTAGIDLIDCLVHMQDPIADRFLADLVRDICVQIDRITQGKSAHDCLFSPQHMANTQCQTYFLFIGRLASSKVGAEVLESFNLFEKLKHLAVTSKHDCYVKLIISSLDYSENAQSYRILAAVLKCTSEASRLYATQFLLVLLRAGLPNFAVWGIELLAEQLSDASRTVYLSALATLHEACELPKHLEQLIQINPKLLHLEEKGALLLIRYLSVPSGYNFLNRKNFVVNELRRWDEYFNYRYVFIIEGETADALTQHQKGEDGRYDKRTTSSRSGTRVDVFLPPHLYGQLARHDDGMKILNDHGNIEGFIHTIENAVSLCETESEIIKIKAALWALGHFCSTILGLEQIASKNVLLYIVHLAEGCVVWSIKATAFYVLGLIATTDYGADCLFKLGWVSTRHDRHDRWPVIQEEHWQLNQELAMEIAEQAPVFDYYETTDVDSSTVEDDLIYVGGGSGTGTGGGDANTARKSSTLPPPSNCTSGHHMRSLSESKTFDYIRIRRDTGSHRNRDNSITESTTSGVSSCESAIGKSVLNEVSSTLTPIPSISSLMTMKSGRKLRRHSESSRTRIPSDRSTVSPAGSTSGKLSFQDHMGYKIIRQIKMQLKDSDDEMDVIPPALARVHSLDRNRYSSTSEDKSLSLMNFIKDGLSLASLASVKKFSVKDESPRKRKGRAYMGIALPMVLTNLFPDYRIAARRLSLTVDRNLFGSDTSSASEISAGTQSSSKKSRFTHNPKNCMFCGSSKVKQRATFSGTSTPIAGKSAVFNQIIEDEEITELKISILNQIEMLSNPLVQKHFRHNLLNLKQKHPHVFQDACLYSDVCKMLAENSYRLMTRRFIQDIFFDANLQVLSRELPAINDPQKERIAPCPLTPVSKTVSRQPEDTKTYQQRATVERIAELGAASAKPKELLSVNIGFSIQHIHPAGESSDLISPTRYQASSPPPLTSVKEENVASSSENILEGGSSVDVTGFRYDAEVQVHQTSDGKRGVREELKPAGRPNSIALGTLESTTSSATKTKVPRRNSASLISPASTSSLTAASPTSPLNLTIKTLDELKLTYKENKFPIKRDEKIVK